MKTPQIVLVLSAISWAPDKSVAAEQMPQCPAQIDGKLIRVLPVQSGWKGIAATRLRLERATVVLGPPDVEARAELRGNEKRLGKHADQVTYDGLGAQQEKWLVCAYGRGGDIEQAVRLPQSVNRCVINTASNTPGGTNQVTVACY
ncbi:STY0301 family protein [Oxalobacteraceae bacterium A2-2]